MKTCPCSNNGFPDRLARSGLWRRGFVLGIAAVLATGAILARADQPESESIKAYKVKSALIYNFLKFIEWPKDTFDEEKTVLRMGVIGHDAFTVAHKFIHDKSVGDYKIEVIEITEEQVAGWLEKVEKDPGQKKELEKFHVVYIASTKSYDYRKLVKAISDMSILSISEEDDFLKQGGMINFLFVDNKIKFEINLDAAETVGLTIRAKLLKLALRVVHEGKSTTS